ncbi:MAG TPA: DUF3105 domain-containing protein [Solirubrobacteraceae bacterium]
MSDRQEEKEPREATAGSEPRRRLVQIGGGVVVACAIVIGIVLAAAGPNGGNASTKAALGAASLGGRPAGFPAHTAPIPARKTRNLAAAARFAGCRLAHPKLEGSSTPPAHVDGHVVYKTNPPTSGDHNPVWSSDGNYVGVRTPAPEHYVHSLEHGRIELQYRPGTAARTISQLQSVMKEPTRTDFGVDAGNGGFALLFQNNTKMPYAVAATAWGQLLGCRSAGSRMFDAIRAFRAKYTLQAPEKIVQAE